MVFYQKDIVEGQSNLKTYLGAAGDGEKTAVCMDLSCILSTFAPGVSEPSPVQGFNEEQLKGIINDLTELKHDKLIIMSEYNPAIEKYKTGHTIVNMFHLLLQGWINQVKS